MKTQILQDMEFYYSFDRKTRFICWLTKDPVYYIAKYIRLLRKEERYSNRKKSKLNTIFSLYYFRKKNSLGNKLGFKIPKNTIGPGLTIYHHGEIIVNEDARIGKNCQLHGGNCIGNKGMSNVVPIIGDNLDLGIGAKIIGAVKVGDNVVVGANAVVVKDVESNSTVVGVPARKIK